MTDRSVASNQRWTPREGRTVSECKREDEGDGGGQETETNENKEKGGRRRLEGREIENEEIKDKMYDLWEFIILT